MKTAYVLLIASLLLAGCTGKNNLLDQFDNSFGNTVTAPTRDSSPPSIQLVVQAPGTAQTTLGH